MQGIKEAELQESGGTGARRVQTSGHLSMSVGEGAVEALKGLKEGGEENLVQLVREPSQLLTKALSARGS